MGGEARETPNRERHHESNGVVEFSLRPRRPAVAHLDDKHAERPDVSGFAVAEDENNIHENRGTFDT